MEPVLNWTKCGCFKFEASGKYDNQSTLNCKLSYRVDKLCLTFSLVDGKYTDRSHTGTGEVTKQATGHLQSVSYCDDFYQTLCETPIIYIKVFHSYMSAGF
jgi:hypothetical protein